MQTFRLTLFYRFFYAGVLLIVAIGLGVGLGWPGAIPGVMAAVVFYVFNRVHVQVDDSGVRYQGWRPGLGWHLAWEEMHGISIDKVVVSSGQDGGGSVYRWTFERKDERPYRIEGYPRAAGEEIMACFRERGLSASIDESRTKGG